MNPIPQAFKPIIDMYANTNSFTGAPIESLSQQKLAPEYRYSDRTSMAARGLSTALNAVTNSVGLDSPSPVKLDYMLNGYFGWLGSLIVGTADVIARPMTNQPVQAQSDLWKIATGNIASSLSDAPSRYVNQMYTQMKEVEQAHDTYRMLLKTGKTQEAAEFKLDNQETISHYGNIDGAKKSATGIGEQIRRIERSMDMGAAEKREALRVLRARQDAIARRVNPL
jgi:hypothetical protein